MAAVQTHVSIQLVQVKRSRALVREHPWFSLLTKKIVVSLISSLKYFQFIFLQEWENQTRFLLLFINLDLLISFKKILNINSLYLYVLI